MSDSSTEETQQGQTESQSQNSSDDDSAPLTRAEFNRMMSERDNNHGRPRPQSQSTPLVGRPSSGLDRDELNRILDERESRKSSQDEFSSLKQEVTDLRAELKKRTRKVFSPWGW